MDAESLFNIFTQDSIEKDPQFKEVFERMNKSTEVVVKFLDDLDNFFMLYYMYTTKLKSQAEIILPKVQKKYYNTLYRNILKADWSNPYDIADIQRNIPMDSLLSGLDELIFFFEELEEYEKCADLKRIQDISSIVRTFPVNLPTDYQPIFTVKLIK